MKSIMCVICALFTWFMKILRCGKCSICTERSFVKILNCLVQYFPTGSAGDFCSCTSRFRLFKCHRQNTCAINMQNSAGTPRGLLLVSCYMCKEKDNLLAQHFHLLIHPTPLCMSNSVWLANTSTSTWRKRLCYKMAIGQMKFMMFMQCPWCCSEWSPLSLMCTWWNMQCRCASVEQELTPQSHELYQSWLEQ